MIPYIKGRIAHQAHVGVPEGTYEEEYARNGFSGRYAHIYRSEPLVKWIDIEGPLKPRAFDLNQCQSAKDYLGTRIPFLENKDVRILFSKMNSPMNYYFRNADGDEAIFVHQGHGKLETDFGPLNYEPGDYLVIPRGTIYKLTPSQPSEFLIIESFSEIRIPDRGMLGQHALFDPAVIKTPEPPKDLQKGPRGRYELKIKRCDEITTVTYPFCPLNTVGWKGTLTVWQLNVRDIRPVLSDRYHLPPSAHTTFIAQNFVICSFLPRPLENGDPLAVKVPFYHSNIDFDEVLFYHKGQFFSRAGIQTGMITFHPQGIHHGPQGQAVARATDLKETNEIAVMIDTKNPLYATEQSQKIEVSHYWKSWMDKTGES